MRKTRRRNGRKTMKGGNPNWRNHSVLIPQNNENGENGENNTAVKRPQALKRSVGKKIQDRIQTQRKINFNASRARNVHQRENNYKNISSPSNPEALKVQQLIPNPTGPYSPTVMNNHIPFPNVNRKGTREFTVMVEPSNEEKRRREKLKNARLAVEKIYQKYGV